jgi:hypothetical protein
MHLYRVDAYVQRDGNLLVGRSGSNETEDLALSLAYWMFISHSLTRQSANRFVSIITYLDCSFMFVQMRAMSVACTFRSNPA